MASLARWEGKLISGSLDSTVRVWDHETGGLDAALTGHKDFVHGLLVQGATVQHVEGRDHPGMGGEDVGGGGEGGGVRLHGHGRVAAMPDGELIEAHQRVWRMQLWR